MYEIEVDVPTRLIVLRMAGFWSIATAQAFVAEQQLAVARLGPPFGTHLTLVDASAFDVQQKEVVEIIRDLVVNAKHTSKRIAVVGNTALGRLQQSRMSNRDESRMFDDLDEARQWLTAG